MCLDHAEATILQRAFLTAKLRKLAIKPFVCFFVCFFFVKSNLLFQTHKHTLTKNKKHTQTHKCFLSIKPKITFIKISFNIKIFRCKFKQNQVYKTQSRLNKQNNTTKKERNKFCTLLVRKSELYNENLDKVIEFSFT